MDQRKFKDLRQTDLGKPNVEIVRRRGSVPQSPADLINKHHRPKAFCGIVLLVLPLCGDEIP